jgi:hypothetical protein
MVYLQQGAALICTYFFWSLVLMSYCSYVRSHDDASLPAIATLAYRAVKFSAIKFGMAGS